MSDQLALALIVFFTIGSSFFCSVLEAGLSFVTIPTLLDQKEKGSKGSALLLHLKKNRVEDAISSILSLNTVSNTIGSTLAGAKAHDIMPELWVGIFTIALVMGILIFSEIIPKTIGANFAVQIAPVVGYSVFVLTYLMYPFVLISRAVTKKLAPKEAKAFTHGDITAMVALAADAGSISAYQSHLFNSLLRSDQVILTDVMTPRAVVAMMKTTDTVGDLLARDDHGAYSRFPLYENQQDNIKGFIIVREALADALEKGRQDIRLDTYLRPATMLLKAMPVGRALRVMTREKEHIAMVLDEHGALRGVVTMEDLIETILGIEIIDESDREVNLRAKATEIRDQRLAGIEKRKLADKEPEEPTEEPESSE